jgi:hypothetical protein
MFVVNVFSFRLAETMYTVYKQIIPLENVNIMEHEGSPETLLPSRSFQKQVRF